MLRFVIFASLAATALALPQAKCTAENLMSSIQAVKDEDHQNACICKSGGACSKLTVTLEGDGAKYSAGDLGDWSAVLEGDHFKITTGPEEVKDTLVFPVMGSNYIVYVFCGQDKEPDLAYVEFLSKDAATPEVLEELKTKKIEVSAEALGKC